MRRRTFLALAGSAAFAWPLARAQPAGRVWRIGVLETISASANAGSFDAFRKALREHGYAEGQNLSIEYLSAEGRAERFQRLAAELVRLKVDLIVTRGTPAALAAKNATTTIPVVMAAIGEPIGTGVVASLASPRGNITGLSAFVTELAAKRVELIKEAVPGVMRVGFLSDMSNPVSPPQWEETTKAARFLNLQAELLDVRRGEDIGRAFETAASRHVDGLFVGVDAVTQENRRLLADSAQRQRLPTIYASREFVEDGGLMSYGVSYPDLYRRAAGLVNKIFKGAKAGDLPVEQPTKFEMIINLKTAKAINLTISESFLLRAEQVIE
jgi:putative tryptophan/tyrosine transport system substrate-binding protein